MSLESALNFAKNASEDKVPFRFQFPVSTKEDFEKLCDKNNVSMTDMILGLIVSSINEDKGVTNISILNIVNKIDSLETSYKELDRVHRETGDDILETTDGKIHYLVDEMESIQLSLKALKRELETRSH